MHSKHLTNNIDVDGDCPVCLGEVRAPDAPSPKTDEDDMGRKNKHKTPQRPAAPPPAVPKNYTRAEDVSDFDAAAAFHIIAAVTNKGFTSRAFEVLNAWMTNRKGDMNLAEGRNWDGTVIASQEPPKCPDATKCSLAYYHWGDCRPYQYYIPATPPEEPAGSPHRALGPPRTITPASNYVSRTRHPDGSWTVNGSKHILDCGCNFCDGVRNSSKAGAASPPPGEIAPGSPLSDEEKIDKVTTNLTNLFVDFFEFTGRTKDCVHSWVSRMVDDLCCPSCNKRPDDYVAHRIPAPYLDERVAAYKAARATALSGKELTSE